MLDLLGIGGQKKGFELCRHPQSTFEWRSSSEVVVRLPPEAGGGFGILLRSLYGTWDAGACWEACIAAVFMKHGLSARAKHAPCLFRRGGGEGVVVFVHGDDFVTVGLLKQCR